MVQTQKSVCANCEKPTLLNTKYCAYCGQKQDVLQRPFYKVVADTLHESLDIDGRLILTLRTLLLSPGKITYDYNLGKRQTYTPPLRMYLVISILFFLFIAQFDISSEQSSEKLTRFYDYFPKLMVLLLPVFALIIQLMFRGTFYIANLIFSVHIHCFAYLCLAALLPLETFEAISLWVLIAQLPISAYLVYYIAKAIKLNFGQTWPKTIFKTAFLIIFYAVIVMFTLEYTHHYFI